MTNEHRDLLRRFADGASLAVVELGNGREDRYYELYGIQAVALAIAKAEMYSKSWALDFNPDASDWHWPKADADTPWDRLVWVKMSGNNPMGGEWPWFRQRWDECNEPDHRYVLILQASPYDYDQEPPEELKL